MGAKSDSSGHPAQPRREGEPRTWGLRRCLRGCQGCCAGAAAAERGTSWLEASSMRRLLHAPRKAAFRKTRPLLAAPITIVASPEHGWRCNFCSITYSSAAQQFNGVAKHFVCKKHHQRAVLGGSQDGMRNTMARRRGRHRVQLNFSATSATWRRSWDCSGR